MLWRFLLVVSLCQAVLYRRSPRVGTVSSPYNYETKYIQQKLDHFSFTTNNQTFQQRYLINRDYWKPGSPIFFYCGNEGDITWFCNNTGFMWDIAPDYNAMLVFAEHRYYGSSLPFGNDSFNDLDHLGFLTSEQALADFDVLISHLKKEHGDTPVVGFGGSYGGMLAAWLRMKYPSAVIGSIAGSAPIWQFPGLTDCELAYRIISSTMKSYTPLCFSNVLQSWKAIFTIANRTDGLSQLSTTFHLCQPLKNPLDLTNWLTEVWFDIAETNYPYPTNFLEPLPAWPLKVICQYLDKSFSSDIELLKSLSDGLQIYYNYTGESSCLDLSQDSRDSLGEKGWSFQACSEMVMPMCTDGINDVFLPNPWNITAYVEDCRATYFGMTPLVNWIEKQYNGKNLTGITNIVFSNGDLDPWSGGGVLESLSDSLIAVVIKDGAHHLDLRAANPSDNDSVKSARQVHRDNISKWLKSYYSRKRFK